MVNKIMKNLNTTEYFYIIQHIQSSRKYAGARWAIGCNPSELLTENGYCTSSNTVNTIIEIDGLDAFQILEIVTEFGEFDNAYDYETWFLRLHDCANSDDWFNYHNNNQQAPAYGTPAFKKMMVDLYGAESSFEVPEIREKIKATLLKKYGYEHVYEIPEVRAKIKATLLEKYGEDVTFKIPEFLEKNKNTNIERYGDEYALNCPEVREKINNTVLEKYGKQYIVQVDEVKDKIKATNLERHGHISPLASKKVQEKVKQTNIERYGHEYSLSCPEIRDKSKATNLERYGHEHVLASKEIREKSKAKFQEKYGCDYYTQSEQYKNDFYSCEYCGNSFRKLNYVKSHGEKCRLNPNKKVEQYTCDHCDTISPNTTSYSTYHGDNCRFNKNGTRYHPLKINICINCHQTFKKPIQLKYHSTSCKSQQLILPDNLYHCTYCNETYDDHEYFKNKHDYNCAKNENSPNYVECKKYKCEQCGDTFTDLFLLNKHVDQIHTIHKCEICNKIYQSSKSLKSHIRQVHK
jgi:hypothetical protein